MRVGVVGAGIAGRLVAYYCLRAGFEVALFDESRADSCSSAAAGLLTPVAELEKGDEVIYHLGLASLEEHWPLLLSALQQPVYFQQRGSLVVAHRQDESELMVFGRRVEAGLGKPFETAALQPPQGERRAFLSPFLCYREDSCTQGRTSLYSALLTIPGRDALRCMSPLDSKETDLKTPAVRPEEAAKQPSRRACFYAMDAAGITELEPEIKKFQLGFYLPAEGQIDSQALLLALQDYLIQHSVQWNCVTVSDVQPHRIVCDTNTFAFDLTIDCRGLGAKSLLTDLRSVRGELIWLHAPNVNITRPVRLMHPRYRLYIVPRPDNIYLIGASEIESEDDSALSVRTALELLTAACSVHPHFQEARILKTATQCRPTLAHHLPRIYYQPGMLALNGLYRHGYLVAPALAVDMLRWIQNGVAARHYPDLWEEMT